MVSSHRRKLWVAVAALAIAAFAVTAVYAYAGAYGLNVLVRRIGSRWVAVEASDARLSPAMRLAMQGDGRAQPGAVLWREVEPGFETAELAATVNGAEVDRVLLARVDPSRFRFIVRHAPAGSKELDDWMRELGAAIVINGSYYGRRGEPDTPLLSGGVLSGPRTYDARHGAFVAGRDFAAIRDLQDRSWLDAFGGAEDAMVSYPLLLAADEISRVKADRRWLANRSFVGQDGAGRIVLGTTTDAFFSLQRFAEFLRDAKLDLRLALNLDGGPVACQAIRAGDVRRDFCGRYETSVHDGSVALLTPILGERRWALPIVLAAVRR
jgi:hypothetical protein